MSRFVTPLSLVIFLGLLPPVQGDDARSPAGKSAPLQLPAALGSHMALPRAMPVPVWGKAAPAEEIAVEFSGLRKTIAADDAGNWKVTLDPLAVSSESRTMTNTASSGVDVLVRAATSQGIGRPDRTHREGMPPSLPAADPGSDRFRCGGRESNFLAARPPHSPTPVPVLTVSGAADAKANSHRTSETEK